MSQKSDDAPMLNDWASEDAISQMEWLPGSPGLYPPLSSGHESLSKPTRQNETLFGDLNTSMAEGAMITLSGTGMTQTRGPEPIGQFQKHFTKPLVPFLTMVYLRAESILQAARSVRVFHMQSRYIARQALNLVILLNDLVDPEEGPDDTQQTGRIHLEDDFIKLLEAMEKWGACGEQGGSVDSEQHLLKIQHHYTQIFKERFYFHGVRDYANDIVYQKLLAYDQRTIENRQRCQSSGNIIQVDYWIGHEGHHLEDQEEPEATPEIRMASSITLGSTDDVVPFSGYASAAPTEAVGYSPLETSMMSIGELNSSTKIYDQKRVPHFRPPPYNQLRDISETPLPIQNKSTDALLVGAHDGDLPTAHGPLNQEINDQPLANARNLALQQQKAPYQHTRSRGLGRSSMQTPQAQYVPQIHGLSRKFSGPSFVPVLPEEKESQQISPDAIRSASADLSCVSTSRTQRDDNDNRPPNPRNRQVGPLRDPNPVTPSTPPSTPPRSRHPDRPDRSESPPTTPAGTEGSNDPEQEEDEPTPSTSLTASTSTLTPSPATVLWARFNVPNDVFLNPPDPARHQLYHQIRQEPWFLNQMQERSTTGDEASRIPGSLPGESVLLAFYDRVPDAQNKTVMRCTICMQTNQDAHLYPRPDRARVHMRHHFELRPVPCNGQCNIRHCRQRFFTNGDLNAHVAGKTEPLVKCRFCAKPLRSKNLQRHIDHFCQRVPPGMGRGSHT